MFKNKTKSKVKLIDTIVKQETQIGKLVDLICQHHDDGVNDQLRELRIAVEALVKSYTASIEAINENFVLVGEEINNLKNPNKEIKVTNKNKVSKSKKRA